MITLFTINSIGLIRPCQGDERSVSFRVIESIRAKFLLSGLEPPLAPVAEGGPESYEGYLGDAPETLFIFLATPYPLR
jgi:hypothetical protein